MHVCVFSMVCAHERLYHSMPCGDSRPRTATRTDVRTPVRVLILAQNRPLKLLRRAHRHLVHAERRAHPVEACGVRRVEQRGEDALVFGDG